MSMFSAIDAEADNKKLKPWKGKFRKIICAKGLSDKNKIEKLKRLMVEFDKFEFDE